MLKVKDILNLFKEVDPDAEIHHLVLGVTLKDAEFPNKGDSITAIVGSRQDILIHLLKITDNVHQEISDDDNSNTQA